jgi:DMSO/TMAO reductase YedYZ molybdopterin-dependent catalytic subunit
MSEGERSRVVRQERPFNAGTPMAVLADPVVPNRLFYVRSHFEVPEIDPGAWRLSVGGAVERPLELSLAGLKELPRREVAVTLECAGNGRTRMRPVPGGTPWDLDAVSTARFAGASLALVLRSCSSAPTTGRSRRAGRRRSSGACRWPTRATPTRSWRGR